MSLYINFGEYPVFIARKKDGESFAVRKEGVLLRSGGLELL
jgi:hypothetical protein